MTIMSIERRDELRRAFNLVANPDDWRAEIATIVAVETLQAQGIVIADVLESIGFFTATEPTWEPIVDAFGETCAWRIRAVGYRMGPAGP